MILESLNFQMITNDLITSSINKIYDYNIILTLNENFNDLVNNNLNSLQKDIF